MRARLIGIAGLVGIHPHDKCGQRVLIAGESRPLGQSALVLVHVGCKYGSRAPFPRQEHRPATPGPQQFFSLLLRRVGTPHLTCITGESPAIPRRRLFALGPGWTLEAGARGAAKTRLISCPVRCPVSRPVSRGGETRETRRVCKLDGSCGSVRTLLPLPLPLPIHYGF